MFVASIRTRHFDFQALGVDAQHAIAALRAGLLAHAKQYSLDDDFVSIDDVNVFEMVPGCCYRDYSMVSTIGPGPKPAD
jgi:hypothetical protein